MKLKARKDDKGELYFVDEWGIEYHRKQNTQSSQSFQIKKVEDDNGKIKYVYQGELPRMDNKRK